MRCASSGGEQRARFMASTRRNRASRVEGAVGSRGSLRLEVVVSCEVQEAAARDDERAFRLRVDPRPLRTKGRSA